VAVCPDVLSLAACFSSRFHSVAKYFPAAVTALFDQRGAGQLLQQCAFPVLTVTHGETPARAMADDLARLCVICLDILSDDHGD
jgi:hypothetical protein